MSSESECLSQRTAFHTAGSHKPIEVKQQSLARVAQIMGDLGDDKENRKKNDDDDFYDNDNECDGEEVDDDLVFSTVPQRSSMSTGAVVTKTNLHFDEIDDDEMRRFAESFEQEQEESKSDEAEDDKLCEDYARKMQTPTKAIHLENNKRKKASIEDLDALLNDDNDDDDHSNDNSRDQQQMSPVFKKKP